MFGFESVMIPVVAIVLVKSLLSYVRVGLRRRSLARRFGCKPVKTYKQHDKSLGLFFLYQKHQKLSGPDVPRSQTKPKKTQKPSNESRTLTREVEVQMIKKRSDQILHKVSRIGKLR